ncbi:MAG: hypothetical protein K0Q53_850 [Massilibacillus sp.]|nr:hypothetical protein [Massilibacillus sp.]
MVGSVCFAKTEIPQTPTSSIYVQDYANVLSTEAKHKINSIGTSLQKQTKAQVVVVTIATLQGTPAEEYSLGVLRQWGIGDKSLNNGVVMLVAVDDKKSRIEVGYGLEGALPDAKTGQIQDEYMLPYFKKGEYENGIVNGYLALTKVVADEYAVQLDSQVKPVKATSQGSTSVLDTFFMIGIAIVIIVLVILDFIFFGGRFTALILAIISSRGGGRGGSGGGGGYGGGSGGGGGSNRGW